MKHIEWMKAFNTGNAVIDTQHERLLECVDELAAFVGEGNGKEVHVKCQEIRKLLDVHFADEEAILREAGFPRLDDHLAAHAGTTMQFSQICSSCNEVSLEGKAGSCIPDMTAVIVHHILHGDMDFKSFLQTKGLAADNC